MPIRKMIVSTSVLLMATGCMASAPMGRLQAPPEPAFKPLTVGTKGVQIEAADKSFRVDTETSVSVREGTASCQLPVTPDDFMRGESLPVTVKVPDLDVPLYGLLRLCGTPSWSGGPGRRAYRVEVPETYVMATTEGRVSVVFEEHNSLPGLAYRSANWILWLSRTPFRGAPQMTSAIGPAVAPPPVTPSPAPPAALPGASRGAPPAALPGAPLAAPAAAPPAAGASASKTGVVQVDPNLQVVIVDGSYRRAPGGQVTIPCGTHTIKAGMREPRTVNVPCGGSVSPF